MSEEKMSLSSLQPIYFFLTRMDAQYYDGEHFIEADWGVTL